MKHPPSSQAPAAPPPIHPGFAGRLDANGPLRVLLVDDHEGVRESLVRLLHQAAGPECQIFQADGGPQALDALERHSVDVAVVDMSMPGMNGFELIGEVARRYPTLPCLMLSMHEEEPYALRAFKAGARGYLMKDRAALEIVPALRRLKGGGVHLSPGVTEKLLIALSGGIEPTRRSRLTALEFEVLERLSLGEGPTEIAQQLTLSAAAVETCHRRIRDRLGLPFLAGLVQYGREHGLTPLPRRP